MANDHDKAKELIARHGLRLADVPAEGERLTARDVERFLEARTPPPEALPRDSALKKAGEWRPAQ